MNPKNTTRLTHDVSSRRRLRLTGRDFHTFFAFSPSKFALFLRVPCMCAFTLPVRANLLVLQYFFFFVRIDSLFVVCEFFACV